MRVLPDLVQPGWQRVFKHFISLLEREQATGILNHAMVAFFIRTLFKMSISVQLYNLELATKIIEMNYTYCLIVYCSSSISSSIRIYQLSRPFVFSAREL